MFCSELAKRSALFRILLYSEHADITPLFAVSDKCLVAVGVVLMVVGLLCMLLFAPVFLLFVSYAVLFPLIQLGLHISNGTLVVTSLSSVLSIVYSASMLALCMLAPVVYSFQSLRIDIIDIRHFPGIFYELPTLKELHRRYELIF